MVFQVCPNPIDPRIYTTEKKKYINPVLTIWIEIYGLKW
jgi:hypothetical protein